MNKILTLRVKALLTVCLLGFIVFHWHYLLQGIKIYRDDKDTMTDIQQYSTVLQKTKYVVEYTRVSSLKEITLNNSRTENGISLSPSPHSDIHINHTSFTRVAFLKVHKAGSSTAQNIFLRYGESRNLTFVLSKVREDQYENIIGLQDSLNENNTLPPPPNKTYDILCCHVLYDRKAFQEYMPSDTAYVGIIREPFQQFLSTLNYFRPYYIFKKNINSRARILEFLRNPWNHEKRISPKWSFTNNRMAVEFGFPHKLFQNHSKEASHSYLRKLDKEFHLVIILEYFVESVVLMRRVLGWTVKDVLYVRKNTAKDYTFVDNTYRHLYERYAKLDYDLYNFFFTRLWKQIELEGIDFQMELLYFRQLLKEVGDYCVLHVRRGSDYTVNASKWSDSFNVTAQDCKYLKMHELTFIDKIRKRQYG